MILKLLKRLMAKITISTGSFNKTYTGKNIIINNGNVIIDGVDVTPQLKNISISIEGNVDSLNVDACNYIKVSNNVNTLTTTSGDISCANVLGNLKTTSGDISCDDISGDVITVSGDVTARNINGKVSTVSGDINT